MSSSPPPFPPWLAEVEPLRGHPGTVARALYTQRQRRRASQDGVVRLVGAGRALSYLKSGPTRSSKPIQ